MIPYQKNKIIELVSFDEIVSATVMSVSSALIATNLENDIYSSRGGYKILSRTRKTVEFIFDDLGPRIVKRAYRMSDKSFWKLLVLIKENYHPGIKLNRIQNG